MRRPNVVMILTDDHAAHAIGAYGSVVNATPRIDEIARLGVRFDNCWCSATPGCWPAAGRSPTS
jgi:arylsulfatase A-like enzyme